MFLRLPRPLFRCDYFGVRVLLAVARRARSESDSSFMDANNKNEGEGAEEWHGNQS